MRNTNLNQKLQYPGSSGTGRLPRRLDDRLRAILMQQLSSLPKVERVSVCAVSDSESLLFAQQIKDYLTEKGWTTEPEIRVIPSTASHGTTVRLMSGESTMAELIVGSNH
jgi:hypothetical protein